MNMTSLWCMNTIFQIIYRIQMYLVIQRVNDTSSRRQYHGHLLHYGQDNAFNTKMTMVSIIVISDYMVPMINYIIVDDGDIDDLSTAMMSGWLPHQTLSYSLYCFTVHRPILAFYYLILTSSWPISAFIFVGNIIIRPRCIPNYILIPL